MKLNSVIHFLITFNITLQYVRAVHCTQKHITGIIFWMLLIYSYRFCYSKLLSYTFMFGVMYGIQALGQ